MGVISHIGLCHDPRGELVYGEDIRFMREDESGMWQITNQINSLLKLLKYHEIRSFLDIGTFRGYTFLLLDSFLKACNPACKNLSIDPFPMIDPGLQECFNLQYRHETSEDHQDSVFDLVFIDGDHSYESSKRDFYNVGVRSKICCFHDINDDFVKTTYADGGVPRLWEELRELYGHEEITAHPSNLKVMGIGVLYVKEEISHCGNNSVLRRKVCDSRHRQAPFPAFHHAGAGIISPE